MNNMVKAGRLRRVPHRHPTLVRMAGAIMHAVEAEQAAICDDDADGCPQEDQGNLVSAKVCTVRPTSWPHVLVMHDTA